jgi:hypothetical protein
MVIEVETTISNNANRVRLRAVDMAVEAVEEVFYIR